MELSRAIKQAAGLGLWFHDSLFEAGESRPSVPRSCCGIPKAQLVPLCCEISRTGSWSSPAFRCNSCQNRMRKMGKSRPHVGPCCRNFLRRASKLKYHQRNFEVIDVLWRDSIFYLFSESVQFLAAMFQVRQILEVCLLQIPFSKVQLPRASFQRPPTSFHLRSAASFRLPSVNSMTCARIREFDFEPLQLH